MLVFMIMYSLFDRKTREYGQIYFARNDESAIRTLLDSVIGSKSQLEKYPDDFDLYRVGTFETDLGVVDSSQLDPFLIQNVQHLLKHWREEPNG